MSDVINVTLGTRSDKLSETYSLPALALVGTILAVLTLWTIIGNALVLIALWKFRALQKTSNFLIGNLSVSDFLLALTVLPMSIGNDLLGRWVFGQIMCNVWLSVDVLYCTASIWSLVAIAFDRFTATSFPVWYRDQQNKSRRFVPYVIVVWVLSILICSPPLIGWDGKRLESPMEKFKKNYVHDNATGHYQCVLFSEPHYVIYSAMGSFIIPLVVLIILYTKIFIVLQRRARQLRKNAANVHMRHMHCAESSKPIDIDVDEDLSELSLSCNVTTFQNVSTAVTSAPEDDSNGFLYAESTQHLAPPSTTHSPGPATALRSEVTEPVAPAAAAAVAVAVAAAAPKKSRFLLVKNSTRKRRQKERHKVASGAPKTGPTTGLRCRQTLLKSDRREQRATKRMALIIFLFVLCWIPFTMMYLIRSLCGEEQCPDYLHLRMFVIWLGYANSGLNPILYTIFNEDFRLAFIKLLCLTSKRRKTGLR